MPPSSRLAANAPSPRLSILVPNYNHAPFLAERIQSIKGQTFDDYELIVLDDASDDDSITILNRELQHTDHQLIVNARNSGSPCSQWLKGIRRARGEFIWIAESDDSCTEDFLATLLPYLERGASLAYCRSAAIDADTVDISATTLYWPDQIDADLWHQPFETSSQSFCRQLMSRANCIPNASAVVFRRDQALPCLAISDRFKDLLFTGDWIFWFQYLAHHQGEVCFVPQPKSWFRSHRATTRSTSDSHAKETRHMEEYCGAVQWISDHPLMLRSGLERQRLLDGHWDWLLLEYLVRIHPGATAILVGQGLHGPLRRLLPFRLALSRQVRGLAFPKLGGWINRRLAAWQTTQARMLSWIQRFRT